MKYLFRAKQLKMRIIICIILSRLLFPFGNLIHAQKTSSDFILPKGQDTIFCYITTLKRSAGNVTGITYIDKNGAEHEIKDKSEIARITSMRVGGYLMEYIPLKANKPDGYKRHIEVSVEGPVKIYDHIRLIVSTNRKGKREFFSVVGAGAVISFLRIRDGKLMDINRKTVNDVLIPYLNKCANFKSSFKEEINSRNFREATKTYNEVCK